MDKQVTPSSLSMKVDFVNVVRDLHRPNVRQQRRDEDTRTKGRPHRESKVAHQELGRRRQGSPEDPTLQLRVGPELRTPSLKRCPVPIPRTTHVRDHPPAPSWDWVYYGGEGGWWSLGSRLDPGVDRCDRKSGPVSFENKSHPNFCGSLTRHPGVDV